MWTKSTAYHLLIGFFILMISVKMISSLALVQCIYGGSCPNNCEAVKDPKSQCTICTNCGAVSKCNKANQPRVCACGQYRDKETGCVYCGCSLNSKVAVSLAPTTVTTTTTTTSTTTTTITPEALDEEDNSD